MKKLYFSVIVIIVLCLTFGIFYFTFISSRPNPNTTEQYEFKKLILGNYTNETNKSASSSYSIRWWDLEPFHLAADDNQQIYLLDIYNDKVHHFNAEGKHIKEISLKCASFPNRERNSDKDDSYTEYRIQVSSSGTYFYIGAYDDYLAIYDGNGLQQRKGLTVDILKRICNDKFISWGQIVDNKMNVVKDFKQYSENEIIDSQYNYYSLDLDMGTQFIVKKNSDKKIIWKKEISGNNNALSLIGADGGDNIYILMSDYLGIRKINSDGIVITNVLLPNDEVFSNENLIKGVFQLLCDGTIYYFPNYHEISGTQSQKAKGEYVIYKFVNIGRMGSGLEISVYL